MKTILAIFFFMMSAAYAQVLDAYHCRQMDQFRFDFPAEDLIGALTELQDCPTDEEIILDKVKSDYDKFYGNKIINSGYVKGFKLKAPAGMLTLANQMLGEKPPKGWKNAAMNCTTVLCAFGKLLNSEKAAMQLFNLKEKSGYFLSFDQTINDGLAEQNWSAKEIQELDAAVDKLPKYLKHMKLDKIERYADKVRLAIHAKNVAAFASPVPRLAFYGNGAKGSPTGPNSYTSTSWPQEVLVHELCHHHDFKNFAVSWNLISEAKGSGFGKLSSWKEKSKKDGSLYWDSHDDAHFVSQYASSSPAEDYAESCMNYILHPTRLEKKAPEKYAYMKKNVFKGQEFKNEIWANRPDLKWEGLNQLLAQEDQCLENVSNCLDNLTYDYGIFCMKKGESSENGSSMSWSNCGDPKGLIQGDSCVASVKKDYLQKIAAELSQKEEKFCDYGGIGTIQSRKDDACKKSITDISNNLKAVTKVDVDPYVKECEAQKDFTEDCVLSQITAKAGLGENEKVQKLIEKIANEKIPDRMTALGKTLANTKTSLWLGPCLSSISKIDTFIMQDSKTGESKEIFHYNAKDSNYSSSYLGQYIHKDYKQNDVNMACANNVVDVLKQSGIKTPTKSSPVNLMQEHFVSELKSFESDVISKIPESIKKCLVIKKCKRKKITELINDWESKDPERRSGLSSAEFVEELFQKVKPEF